MPVGATQPLLRWDLERLSADPALAAATGTSARAFGTGHGRLEVRRLRSSTALAGDRDRPGLAQAPCLEREVVRPNTGGVRRERACAVTSLAPGRADAQALPRLWRGRWAIENRLRWVRDGGFAEDRSAARAGGVPPPPAAARNTAVGPLRAHGHAAIAATRRALARPPAATLALLGR